MIHLRPVQFHLIPGGISAEQGPRMMILFRLAKMISAEAEDFVSQPRSEAGVIEAVMLDISHHASESVILSFAATFIQTIETFFES
jgi:hypothetical protein